MALTMRMGEPTPRRSLAAPRRTTKLFTFDDNNEKENSLNESLTGRRQSRLFNNSINTENINDEPIQTPTQLVDLYQKTLELAAQGKINIKNAFSIPLVERLPQVLNVIALDDKDNHHLGPNFVKAGSVIDTSAKIYGFRVDALYTETQKLSGNILNTEEEEEQQQHSNDGENKEENRLEVDNENIDSEQNESKKPTRRIKTKATSFVVNDLSKITLEHEFEFRPLQPPNICQWRGGIGKDSIYAEMVSSTMYSSSDYPLIDGFTNANSQPEEQQIKIENILNHTIAKIIDLTSLRDVIKNNETYDHILGNQALRDFSFNEIPSDSFINTIHESCLGQNDESIDNRSYTNNDENDNDDGYNHDELIHAAIEDFNDDPSHTNEIFKNALNELSNQDPSSMHSNLGNYQSQHSANLNLPSANEILSSSFMSTVSFADQMPNLLHSKDVQSEYSYFDATKLKLFAGPNIWKYTNLLNITKIIPTNNSSIIQQQQAPAIRQRINNEGGNICIIGPKRSIRVDFFNQLSIDQIMSNINNGRDKKTIGISQSALLLRIREKSFNQTQLARKLRPLNDLINSPNFPELNFEYLHLINRYKEKKQEQIHENHDYDDFDDNNFHVTIEHHDDEDAPLTAMQYDFIRPVHYEKIEFAKGSTSVNAKNLKRQMIEEFTRQKLEQQRTLSLDTSTTSQQSSSSSSSHNNNHYQQPIVEFSILCENLSDHGHLSLQTDLASAFYCMLINCNENKLYMKSNSKRDDLYIQECPFTDRRDLSTLSYSYTSSSNLSTTSLIVH
ncbi:unnamed protein product [Rotaria sp. Silwood1]|nr:unnamed protein product [Rotaria sp. Silwood1]CAF1598263.1 unnamed protein product [Rotaria sp. Silwood1]